MKRILWPCLLCILAGCSSQAGSGQPAKLSAEGTKPFRVAVEERKTADDGADAAVNAVTTIPVPEGGKPLVARADGGTPPDRADTDVASACRRPGIVTRANRRPASLLADPSGGHGQRSGSRQ